MDDSGPREMAPPANARAFGAFEPVDVDIYVEDAAMRDAVGFAFSTKDRLVLGVLAGELGTWKGRTFVVVRAFIPARKAQSTTGSAKFTREAWEDVKQIRQVQYPDLRMVGWMQSLPGFGVVITQMSASLHKSYFDLPHQVLLTVDPVSDDVGFFGWRHGKLERASFFAFTAPAASATPVAPKPAAPPPKPVEMPAKAVDVPAKPAPEPPKPAGPKTFRDLLAEHGMAALHRQLHVVDVLGPHSWEMDLDAGKIKLGEQHTFPVQVLGTAADAENTWLWGWANEGSGIPNATLASALALRRLGEQHGIAEFTEPMLSLDELDPGALTLVATGVCTAAFSYRAAYEGGAAYLLVPLPGLGPAPTDLARAVTVVTQFIGDYDVEHREAVRAYLKYLGLQIDESARRLVGRSMRAGSLTIELDVNGRVSRVSTGN